MHNWTASRTLVALKFFASLREITDVSKKLTMKELGALQETAAQSLLAGKGKSELVASLVSDGIDELTAQRIVDTAAQRVRRQGDGTDVDSGKPARGTFNYHTVTGALFLSAGVGAIAYVQVTGNGSEKSYAIGGVAIMLGLYRLARGVIR